MLLVLVPPVGLISWFILGLLWDLCSLVLEGKRLLPPLDVEVDIRSTSIDDNSRGVQEWPPRMMGDLSSTPVSITTKSAGTYEVPTQTHIFFSIPFGKLSV